MTALVKALPSYASDAAYPDQDAEPGDGVMYDVNAKCWGGAHWVVIHMAAYAYPDEPNTETRQAMYQQFDAMRYTIPCSACRAHYREFWAEHPIDDALASRDALIDWTTVLHERVNETTGAAAFDLAAYLKRLLGEDVVSETLADDEQQASKAAAAEKVEAVKARDEKTHSAKSREPTSSDKRVSARRSHTRRGSGSGQQRKDNDSLRAAMYIAQTRALESMQRAQSMRAAESMTHTFTWKHYVTQTQRRVPSSSRGFGRPRTVRPPKDCPDCQKEVKASKF